MSEQSCYHCGLPVPDDSHYQIEIQCQQRDMCCPGCLAVASAITSGGMEKFYQFRSSAALRPESDTDKIYAAYDLPEVADTFLEQTEAGHQRVRLSVAGMTCAACAWLIEKHFSSKAYIQSVRVNVSSNTATVEWHASDAKLSDILKGFAELGYQARPAGDESASKLRAKENRDALLKLWVAGLGMMQAGMLAIALYAGALQGIDPDMKNFLRWVSLLFVTPVVFYSGSSFLKAAWVNIKLRALTMDLPVSLAILLAWSASVWGTIHNNGEVYFDSVSMFIFFLLTGRYLERRVRHRNEVLGEGFSQLLPLVATRIGDKGAESVPVNSLVPGEQIRVSAGDPFPCDGRVVKGNSAVNEALLTGEERPVQKSPGDEVCAGSINGIEMLYIEVEKVGQHTRLSSIMELVERAESEKPPQRALADKLASYFVSAVLIVATLVAISWWLIAPEQALWVTISVLVVTCPCALSLATPAALAVASAELRRGGFLVTRGHVIEALADADTVVLDKTGTVTLGAMKVSRVVPIAEESEEYVLQLASALEEGSNHPIGRALQIDNSELRADDIQQHPGQGVSGCVGGKHWVLGKPSLVTTVFNGLGVPQEPDSEQGNTLLLLAEERTVVAWISLEDSLREGAADIVQSLLLSGKQVEILSGDRQQVVSKVAKTLGITHYQGDVSSEGKLAHIRQLQSTGQCVVMVGDGINDVPVLSGADVSVAMGDASDLTRIHGDSILLSGDFKSLRDAFSVSVQTRQIIRQNMSWALLYNLLALPLAAAGWVPPWAAAIGMSASSLLVVLNALRIKVTDRDHSLAVTNNSSQLLAKPKVV